MEAATVVVHRDGRVLELRRTITNRTVTVTYPGPQGPTGEVSQATLTANYVPLAGDATITGTKRLQNVVVKEHPIDARHPDFGGLDLTGATSSHVALQAAIDYTTGSANPATTTRRPSAPLYLPPGILKVSVAPAIRSTLGFHLVGAGMDITRLRGSGALARVLDIDGSAHGIFENFTIDSDNTGTVTTGLALRWSAASSRSTTSNRFDNIRIDAASSAMVNGVHLEGNNQVDSSTFTHLIVTGQWVAGETVLWQNAVLLGDGVSANNLDHTFLGIELDHWRYNVHGNGSNYFIFGAEIGGAEADFKLTQISSGPNTVKGVRSEDSQRLYEAIGAASISVMMSFEDVGWYPNALHADQKWIRNEKGGTLRLANVHCHYDATAVGAIMELVGPAAATTILAGVSAPTAWPAAIGASTTRIVCLDYFERGVGGTATAHTTMTLDLPDNNFATFVANDATPSVGRGELFRTANTAATTITNFDDGRNGQVIEVHIADAFTTIQSNSGLRLAGGGLDFVAATNDSIRLRRRSNIWLEIGRATNVIP